MRQTHLFVPDYTPLLEKDAGRLVSKTYGGPGEAKGAHFHIYVHPRNKFSIPWSQRVSLSYNQSSTTASVTKDDTMSCSSSLCHPETQHIWSETGVSREHLWCPYCTFAAEVRRQ